MPPRKKTTETTTAPATEETLKDVLNFEDVKDGVTVEQARIAELEKKVQDAENLEKTNPVTETGVPVAESELTPDQKRIRELEDQLAKIGAKNFEARGLTTEDSEDGVLIHILEDGFTAQGLVFYRGQEIKFGPRAVTQTRNVEGESWLDLSDAEQMSRYDGRVMFRKGPWPGTTYQGEAQGKSTQVTAPVINI